MTGFLRTAWQRNEEHYKPVVDQIPRPLKKLVTEKSGRTLGTLGSLAVLPDDEEEKAESVVTSPPVHSRSNT